MQYLEYFSYVAVLGFAFHFVYNYALGLLQIPFLFIHKYANYPVLIFGTYIFSLFFSEFAFVAVSGYGLSSAIIFFNAFIAFFLLFIGYSDSIKNKEAPAITSILPILAFAFTLILFYTKIHFLSAVTDFIFFCFNWILNVSPIGKVLKFLVFPIGGVASAGIICYFVIMWIIGTTAEIASKKADK